MKKIIVALAILISSFTLISQGMYLKKVLQIEHPTNSVTITDYYYHNNWDMEKIINTDVELNLTTTSIYENDTLKVYELSDGSTLDYYYTQDSISSYLTIHDSITYIYYKGYKDDNNHIVDYEYLNPDGIVVNYTNNNWDNNNLTASTSLSVFTTDVTYYTEIKNPLFNSTKYIRSNWFSSYNYPDEVNRYNAGGDYQYLVDSLVNEYPKSVRVFVDDEHKYTITYEYYYVSGIEDDITQYNLEILSSKYYNIIGQEISKPNKGFYIQRQLTNKGVMSQKYFVK